MKQFIILFCLFGFVFVVSDAIAVDNDYEWYDVRHFFAQNDQKNIQDTNHANYIDDAVDKIKKQMRNKQQKDKQQKEEQDQKDLGFSLRGFKQANHIFHYFVFD